MKPQHHEISHFNTKGIYSVPLHRKWNYMKDNGMKNTVFYQCCILKFVVNKQSSSPHNVLVMKVFPRLCTSPFITSSIYKNDLLSQTSTSMHCYTGDCTLHACLQCMRPLTTGLLSVSNPSYSEHLHSGIHCLQMISLPSQFNNTFKFRWVA